MIGVSFITQFVTYPSFFEIDNSKFKITNGSYQIHTSAFSDLKIKELYQNSFAVIVPLKNVFQPSGCSVTLQAMACGKPVILTLTKGLWAPKFFKNYNNCILVSPENSNDIEESIRKLENDQERYQSICLEARKTVERYFSLDVANQSTLEIFRNFT